jgi:hypothetical protein
MYVGPGKRSNARVRIHTPHGQWWQPERQHVLSLLPVDIQVPRLRHQLPATFEFEYETEIIACVYYEPCDY